MCPVFMPDLYTREQQLATASGELNQAIMRKILQKHLAKMYSSSKLWKPRYVKKLLDGVDDTKLKVIITSPGGIWDLLLLAKKDHKIEAPFMSYQWDNETVV